MRVTFDSGASRNPPTPRIFLEPETEDDQRLLRTLRDGAFAQISNCGGDLTGRIDHIGILLRPRIVQRQ